MSLAIKNLLCEYQINPLGIDLTSPRLSWQLAGDQRSTKQVACQVFAASSPQQLSEGKAGLWDSNRQEIDQSIHIRYDGQSLESRQRVYWQVQVWDNHGNTATSDVAWFETGLLKNKDWQASWISAQLGGGARSNVPVPYLRRAFQVPATVTSARLYVTALGLYECFFNGQRVTEDVLTPGWTDYDKRLRYQVYDVSDLLQEGNNAWGALLGDGWAAGFVGISNRQAYVDKPMFFAQLEVTLANGDTLTIVSDESWKHQFGAILESDLLMGEAYDARLELTGWNTTAFDDGNWLAVETHTPTVNLVASASPMIRKFDELSPVAPATTTRDFLGKRDIIDLGQNMVGRIRFRGSAPRGTAVVFTFAEVLDENGNLYTDNLRSARATDVYTFKGEGEEVWESKFTFHGFRYVQLSGYPAEVTTDTVTGIVLHSNLAQTGSFECSDPLLNQLQNNILWGQKGNFLDVPTDCPQRDERLGWTGDIQVFARTAAFNMNVAGFLSKWADDVRDAQNEAGAIPAVVPNASITLPDGGPAWADAAIICPWTVYQCYGDTEILARNYDVMTRFMDFLLAESPGHIRCAPDYEGWRGFGDWLSINADTPRDLIGTAFLAYDAKLMAQIATLLGHGKDSERYTKLFKEVKTVFANRFLKGGTLSATDKAAYQSALDTERADTISRGNLEAVDYGPVTSEIFNTDLFTPTQTAYVLALHFDLLPDDLRATASQELVADIKRRDMHLSTGFVGAPYLPHVLSDNDQLDTAYALLKQTSWPSWLYSVTQGGTTIWERWDGWTEERGFQSRDMNSFNHYAYGSIGSWLYQVVAGLKPGQAGYKHSVIHPRPGGGLSHARASLETPYGRLSSSWQLESGMLECKIVVPSNTSATVYLPNVSGAITEGSKALSDSAIRDPEKLAGAVRLELGSGTYVFRYLYA